jgi:serine/threonine-protein kinase
MPTLEDAPTMRDEHRHATGGGAKVQVDASPIDGGVSPVRYQMGDLLGEGGMGEVRRCRDLRIGRDVAMKTVREIAADRDFVHDRFLREARVQGQLEHPCIVPVYDLGAREDGTTYFTMKRIRGETLEQILDALRADDPAASARWTRRKLLAAFVTACGAVEYAHSRGVIHRDLKPGNIMLGDFGEVYVLDWGVARVLDGSADPVTERIDAPMPELGRTVEGAVIGTAGYMSIEQLSGVSDLDGRADVYALGAILFELLAWEPLHVGTTLPGLVTSTLVGPTRAPRCARRSEMFPLSSTRSA